MTRYSGMSGSDGRAQAADLQYKSTQLRLKDHGLLWLLCVQELEAAMGGDEDVVNAFLARMSAREAKLRHRAVRTRD